MRQLNSILFLLFLISYSHSLYSQTDDVGSGRAMSFNGTTDYIDFGDRYSDLKLPFTISAWVHLDPSNAQPGPIFTNRNCDPVYTGFRLIVNNNVISLDYGDGFGGNNPAFRRGKIAAVNSMTGKWNHVTAVVRGPNDMDLYLNGVNVGGDYSGGSLSPMDSGKPGFTSTGYFISNGVIYRFNGIIDEMRLWNRAITETEIRQTMCVNLQGNEPGLIGYWDFNETSGNTVFDKSPNQFNGQFVGNPQRVFSGAAIGDVSTYTYSASWSGTTVSHQDNDHRLQVKNINGNVLGVQIYEVKNVPSQTTGLDLNNSNKPYFGVFLVSQYSGTTFDADYSLLGNQTCELFLRDDNSKSLWVKTDNPILQKSERGEIVMVSANKTINLDLGVDKILCDQSSYVIPTGITDPQLTFQWSTGQNTPLIQVSQSGLYSVKVFGYCSVVEDTIRVDFKETPKPVSLGNDKIVCDRLSYEISTGVTDPQFTFQWNTGQTTSSILASLAGLYSVKVIGYCGVAEDSMRLTFKESPKFFLGDDKILCDNTTVVISTGINDDQFTFQWNTGQTTSFISVNETGWYSVKALGYCGTFKDSIKISFEEKPKPFSLGEDSELCVFEPSILQPLVYSEGMTFLWQDGSTDPTLKADSFGEFWVNVKNSCGEQSDTIRFSKKNYSLAKLPNVITPNADAKNDYFVVDDEIIGLVSLRVLNRWGSEVYYSSAYLNKWDGENLSSGIYYIVLDGPCIEQRKGVVTIMR